MSDALTRLLDATWPAEDMVRVGPFTLRRGGDGGKRVSAATAHGPVSDDDVTAAEQAMDARGQQAMFAVHADQVELDRILVARTYLTLDPTQLFRAKLADLAEMEIPPNRGFAAWPPLQVQREIWATGQIGPARQAIMDRVAVPKTAILGRCGEKAAGAGFVAVHDGVAVLHALAVLPELRRQGAARTIVLHAARWGRDNGADRLVALVTEANAGASTLLEGLGFAVTDAYHYRIRP